MNAPYDPDLPNLEPLSVAARMKLGVIQPLDNPLYLAATMRGEDTAPVWQPGAAPVTFPCPLCTGTVTASRATSTAAIALACSTGCSPHAVREACQTKAPLAFAHRDDLIPVLPPEAVAALEARLHDGAMDSGTIDVLGRGTGKVLLSVLDKMRGGASSTATYAVTNEVGGVVAVVVRADRPPEALEGKSIRQVHAVQTPDGRTEVTLGLFAPPWPLVALHSLAVAPDKPVLVVEGEKARDAAEALLPERVCVTSLCGAGNPHHSDWTPLAGRQVVILGDKDEDGVAYGRRVAAELIAVGAASVRIAQPPASAPDKWDLADPLPPGVTLGDLRQLLDAAPAARWEDVRSALRRDTGPQEWPPFRLPDGHLAGNAPVLDGIAQALQRMNPGCGRAPWLRVLGCLYHALGPAGLRLAVDWSRRDADKHRKFHPGEVEQLFDAFAARPHPRPMHVRDLFWQAWRESKASNSEEGWRPDAEAVAEAEIAAFAQEHRKLVQGDNVYIAIQKRGADGRYSVERKSERTAESIYKSRRVTDRGGKKQVSVYKLWEVHSQTKPLEVVFRPGAEVGSDQYNSFAGFGVQPVVGGRYTMFRQLVDRICDENKDKDRWLWNCIAYRMQNPGKRMGSAFCLVGPQGSGKSTVLNVIATLAAPHSIRLADPELFVGKFNACLEGRLFVACDEMTLGRRNDWCDKLNNYVTEDIIGVEEKNHAQVQIENRMWIGMTANRSDVVRVNKGERRYAMYRVSDPFDGDQNQRTAHYGALFAELEAGGYEALMHDLLHHEIPASFNRTAIPQTPFYQELVGLSVDRDPLPRWWQEVLERGTITTTREGGAWTDAIPKDVLYGQYTAWCEGDGPASKRAVLSKAEWAKKFGGLLPGGLETKRVVATTGGPRVHVLVLPAYTECCDHLDTLLAVRIDRAEQGIQVRCDM